MGTTLEFLGIAVMSIALFKLIDCYKKFTQLYICTALMFVGLGVAIVGHQLFQKEVEDRIELLMLNQKK
jgi:hypothetical protein